MKDQSAALGDHRPTARQDPPRHTSDTTLQVKMQRCTCLLFASLIFCATVSETFGLVLSAKDKRGWTVNSAGYLLGPSAIDKVFNAQPGLAGKRDIQLEGNTKAGILGRPLTDDNVLRMVIEFLTFLHLKEAGVLDDIPATLSSEETNQS
ncbi:galanin peptides isoform X2 [Podarcis lilfordi]|uniref:Galanin peptides n=2 Tax=Podarcis lilfordi TaxID=74358 RepID=A0AA35NVK8_9SAUR|nr:galanin peptides isoform X2 [Podarcis lilfordi]